MQGVYLHSTVDSATPCDNLDRMAAKAPSEAGIRRCNRRPMAEYCSKTQTVSTGESNFDRCAGSGKLLLASLPCSSLHLHQMHHCPRTLCAGFFKPSTEASRLALKRSGTECRVDEPKSSSSSNVSETTQGLILTSLS